MDREQEKQGLHTVRYGTSVKSLNQVLDETVADIHEKINSKNAEFKPKTEQNCWDCPDGKVTDTRCHGLCTRCYVQSKL